MLAGAPAFAQIAPAAQDVLQRVHAEKESRFKVARDHLFANRAALGLDEFADFEEINSHVDKFGQTHTRFQQLYRGVKVWGGTIITHLDPQLAFRRHTNVLKRDIDLDVRPRFSKEQAIEIALTAAAVQGPRPIAPQSELVIYPITEKVILDRFTGSKEINAEMVETRVVRYALAHHVQLKIRNKYDGARSVDVMVDALSGDVLTQWNSLQTTAAIATGNSLYSGTVYVWTNSVPTGYEMRDLTRGTGGKFNNNVVLDYGGETHAISQIFQNATNTWGDGQNYIEGVTTSPATRQTAAVDIAYGFAATWDMLKMVMNRNGLDGLGTSTYAVAHDPLLALPDSMGVNAYWEDDCYCMRFGDGNDTYGYKNLTTLDITAHELTHGLTSKSAKLIYWGEPGGLNEATSDIFATMTEFHKRGNGNYSIPNTGGNWTIGEGVRSSPLRYMYKPSLDGRSADAWSLHLGDLDPHYSSGPMNRAFYFLSQGATTSGNTSTLYLPSGMTGIGNDAAAIIWYRALTTYMSPASDYVAARQAAISAAIDLWGSGSREEKAVWNAFHGINVGNAWSAASCGKLDSGRELAGGDKIYSCNGQSYLNMQTDGNLVLYRASDNYPLWHSGTYNHPGSFAIMQSDGNLVIYEKGVGSNSLWDSGTYSSPGAFLAVQDDLNMVINSPNGIPVWYVTAPPNAATIHTASGTNNSFATADAIDATKTGIKGAVMVLNRNYFRLTVPAGKTLSLDFLGTWMPTKWVLNFYDANQSQIGPDMISDGANTRITGSYQNTTGSSQTIYLLINTWSPQYVNRPYTIALKYL